MTTELTTRPQERARSVNSQLRSLASSHGVDLSSGKRLVGRYDEYGAYIGSDLVPDVVKAGGTPEQRQTVADAIAETMRPAPRDTIEAWIAELSVIAPSRQDDEMTAMLRLEAYGRRLAGYPGDMVQQVLLGRTWRFFPSWHELQQQLEPMVREREAMRAACLRKAYNPASKVKPERVSAGRASEIMAEAGFRPKTFGGDK